MKLGPLDLNQPSTWRGLLGFAGVIGFTLKPELRDQIAAVLAALLCLIEMLRDEYRAQTARNFTPTATATTIGPARPDAGAAAGAAAERLPVPARAETRPNFTDSNPGFNDR